MQTGFSTYPRQFIRILVLVIFMSLAHSGVYAQRLLTVQAGDLVFVAEAADSAAQRQQGLSGRDKLKADHGLLMVLPRPQRVGVWMKDMQFPLDVVWISSFGKVIDIQTLQPCQQAPCPVYRPAQKARYVLEVGAGLFPLNPGQGVEILGASRDSLLPPDPR